MDKNIRHLMRSLHACDATLLKLQDELEQIARDEPTWTTELEAISEEIASERRTMEQLRDELAAAVSGRADRDAELTLLGTDRVLRGAA